MEPLLHTELSYLGHLNHWMCRSLACCFTPKNLGNLGSNPSALCRRLANLTCIAGHLLLAISGRFGLRNRKTQCFRCKKNGESIAKVEPGQAKAIHATTAPGCLRTSKTQFKVLRPELPTPQTPEIRQRCCGDDLGLRKATPSSGPCPLNRQLP